MSKTLSQPHNASAAAAFLAAVWLIAAAVQPTMTYHLAPVLVAGIIPVIVGANNMKRLVKTAAVGGGVATATALVLASFGLLRGPTLLPYGDALAEALTFAGVGAVAGLLIAVIAALRIREPVS